MTLLDSPNRNPIAASPDAADQAGTDDAPPVTEADFPPPPATKPFGPGESPAYAPNPADFPDPPEGYFLEKPIGTGGMGAVYLAMEEATGRRVAVKYLSFNIQPAAKERFRREASALAGLSHPNVVPVYAVNLRPRDPYFTMEYAPGGTLARQIAADGPLDPGAAAAVVAAVARGLNAAHAVGIVHRDVKPSNILLAGDGTPKLADFGLARTKDASSSLTGSLAVVGTPCYMSPEQALGRKDIGAAADVYSLGATLFECLTGRTPFTGEAGPVLEQVKFEDPPTARGVNRAVPPGLSAIVEKCLRKKAKDRYASAADLAADLERWRRGGPLSVKPSTPVTRAGRAVVKRWRWAAAAAAVLVSAGAGMAVRPGPAESLPRAFVPAGASGEPPAFVLTGEYLRKEIEAARPVTLVGASGPPKSYRWMVGDAEFKPEPGGGSACYFEPQYHSLLELAPADGPDEYVLTAELKQYPVLRTGFHHPSVALYWGGREAFGENGQRTFALQLMNYSDTDPATTPDGPSNRLRSHTAFLTNFHMKPNDFHVHWGQSDSLDLKVIHAGVPGPWRTLRVTVTKALVRAELVDASRPAGAAVVTEMSQKDAAKRYAHFQTIVGNGTAGALAVPGWGLRGSAGIWCFQGGVAVRNVVLSPTN